MIIKTIAFDGVSWRDLRTGQPWIPGVKWAILAPTDRNWFSLESRSTEMCKTVKRGLNEALGFPVAQMV